MVKHLHTDSSDKRAQMPHKTQGGFTLIEIMVVVVIIGVLASIVVPNVMDKPHEARIVKAKNDIRAIESALNMYKLENYRYPTTDIGIAALVEKPSDAKNWKQGGYLPKIPKDPWQNDYQYIYPGQKGQFDLYSMGADGQLGGDGADADIGNWALE